MKAAAEATADGLRTERGDVSEHALDGVAFTDFKQNFPLVSGRPAFSLWPARFLAKAS